MLNKKFDTIVVGGGIVGLSTAYHLKKKYPNRRILILEKEETIAKHQTGHNSGVIHSGIYYKPGSLKAKNCRNGYKILLDFCKINEIPFELCGKIIVASNENEITALNNIYDRGLKNGLENLKMLSKDELLEYEPHCRGVAAIHVPQTGIIDYKKVAEKLYNIFTKDFNGEVWFGNEVIDISIKGNSVFVQTQNGAIESSTLVTCAGLQSDRLANMSHENNDLRIIPFRGEYYKLKEDKRHLVKNLLYPVPNPNFPFLGVHFTRMMNGGVEAGPNAVLAFKREGYKIGDFSVKDLAETLSWPGFWKVALKYGKTGVGEMYRSLSKSAFTKALQKLIPEIKEEDLEMGGSGVRAQACSKDGKLIDDFDIVNDGIVIHVRNAPSPAATSCFSIGEYISNFSVFN